MRITKKAYVGLPALALASVGITAISSESAYAGTGNCQLGYACIWEHISYNGKSYGQSVNNAAIPASINNKASAAAANGRTCRTVRFYDYGAKATGSYFELNSKYAVGNNFKDPDLRNGAGFGPYKAQNWNDRVSRIMFMRCN